MKMLHECTHALCHDQHYVTIYLPLTITTVVENNVITKSNFVCCYTVLLWSFGGSCVTQINVWQTD